MPPAPREESGCAAEAPFRAGRGWPARGVSCEARAGVQICGGLRAQLFAEKLIIGMWTMRVVASSTNRRQNAPLELVNRDSPFPPTRLLSPPGCRALRGSWRIAQRALNRTDFLPARASIGSCAARQDKQDQCEAWPEISQQAHGDPSGTSLAPPERKVNGAARWPARRRGPNPLHRGWMHTV